MFKVGDRVRGHGVNTEMDARKSKVVVEVNTHEQPFELDGHLKPTWLRKVYTAYTSLVDVSIFVTPHFTVQEPGGIECCASFRRLFHHHRSGMRVLFVFSRYLHLSLPLRIHLALPLPPSTTTCGSIIRNEECGTTSRRLCAQLVRHL